MEIFLRFYRHVGKFTADRGLRSRLSFRVRIFRTDLSPRSDLNFRCVGGAFEYNTGIIFTDQFLFMKIELFPGFTTIFHRFKILFLPPFSPAFYFFYSNLSTRRIIVSPDPSSDTFLSYLIPA